MDEKRDSRHPQGSGIRILTRSTEILVLRLNKEILRLSMPAIVSNITVPLLGLCDTAISGHLGSELYLAAIAVGSMILDRKSVV